MNRFMVCSLLIVVLSATAIYAQQYPQPTGFVNDFAQLLSREQGQSLNEELIAFEKRTSVEIVVVTVTSLENEDIRRYAAGLANAWGVGKKEINNGVIFLIAPNEREMYIEAAPGISHVLTKWRTDRIRDRVVLPNFKAGNLAEGIIEGARALIQVVDEANTPPPPPHEWTAKDTRILLCVLFSIVIVVLSLILIIPPIRRRMARSEVLKTKSVVAERIAELHKLSRHPDVKQETYDKFVALERKFRAIEQLKRDSVDVDWLGVRETLVDMRSYRIGGVEFRMKDEIAFAKKAREEGPKLMQELPGMIKAAEEKLGDDSRSKRASKFLSEARAQYQQASSQQQGMTVVDWVILYMILSSVLKSVSHAESAMSSSSGSWGSNSPHHSRHNDDHGFGGLSGFGGGGGFTGGGSAGNW